MNKNSNHKSGQTKSGLKVNDNRETNTSKDFRQIRLIWSIQRIAEWFTLGMFTFIGFAGNLIVLLSFILAHYIHSSLLLLSVSGIAINWLSISLSKQYKNHTGSGRWHQLVLTFILDWSGIFLIILGFMIYIGSPAFLFGLLLLILYTLKVMISLLGHKITDEKYPADWELINWEQQRLLLTLTIIAEFFMPWSIVYSSIFICALLCVTNTISLRKLFIIANERDEKENNIEIPYTNIEHIG